jgi:hypothetical protein
MRVSSLSDAQVLRLVRTYFVPVLVSRDNYQRGPADRAERDELARIDHSRRSQGFAGGTVCLHLLTTDGSVGATLTVHQAVQAEKVVALLKEFAEREKVKPRDPDAVQAATEAPAAVPRPQTEGGLLLNVWTRREEGKPNRGLSSDRVELTAGEWQTFVPGRDAEAGSSWRLPAGVVDKILQYAYPPLPHWKVSDGKMVSRSLTATVVSVSAREMVVRLEGRLEMLYPYTGKPDDGRVTARLTGLVRIDRDRAAITTLVLASEEAEYVWYWQGQPKPSRIRIAVEMQAPGR